MNNTLTEGLVDSCKRSNVESILGITEYIHDHDVYVFSDVDLGWFKDIRSLGGTRGSPSVRSLQRFVLYYICLKDIHSRKGT